MYAMPTDGYGPAHWQDLLACQAGVYHDRRQELAAQRARMLHARNCRQAKREFLARQADLFPLLPNPRNAGFPVSGNPVHDVSSGEQPALRVFSSSIPAAVEAIQGGDGAAGAPLNGVFSAPAAEGDFSCARVVAPHISPTGGNSPSRTATSKTRLGVTYRNEAGNTWSGRGKKPQWVISYLSAGGSLDDLHVD